MEEICRIFRVPPHMVQDLKRATYSNIEHQSIDFVVHTLDPWLIRIEKAIIKDVLLDEEKDAFFPKFNVDGLLRGDIESRMRAYGTGISNGFFSPNDARRKENMPLIPAEEGGDYYFVNGSFVRLRDVGAAYSAAGASQPQPSKQEQPKSPDPPKEEPAEEEPENKRHTERHNQRKAARKTGGTE